VHNKTTMRLRGSYVTFFGYQMIPSYEYIFSSFFLAWKWLFLFNKFIFCWMQHTVRKYAKSGCLVDSLLQNHKLNYSLASDLTHTSVRHFLHHHYHHPLLLLTSTTDSKLIFSTNPFLCSSFTFPHTGLTPRTPAVFRFSRTCRF